MLAFVTSSQLILMLLEWGSHCARLNEFPTVISKWGNSVSPLGAVYPFRLAHPAIPKKGASSHLNRHPSHLQVLSGMHFHDSCFVLRMPQNFPVSTLVRPMWSHTNMSPQIKFYLGLSEEHRVKRWVLKSV